MDTTNTSENFNLFSNIFKNKNSNNTDVTNDKIKNNNLINIFYDKKWIIIIGVVLIMILIYIYYNDISLCVPLNKPYNLFDFSKKTSDDISDLNTLDDWNLESEINEFMELQDNYIQTFN